MSQSEIILKNVGIAGFGINCLITSSHCVPSDTKYRKIQTKTKTMCVFMPNATPGKQVLMSQLGAAPIHTNVYIITHAAYANSSK